MSTQRVQTSFNVTPMSLIFIAPKNPIKLQVRQVGKYNVKNK